MRFEVKKSLGNDYYIIWDSKLKQNYRTNGVLMRGSEVEMLRTADNLNRLQSAKEKLKKKSEMAR